MPCSYVEMDRKEPEDREDLMHMTFKEFEGTRVVKDTISDDFSSSYTKSMKLWKINIGSEENPNMASIEDYWDEQTFTKIQALLREYEDLFTTRFL